MNLRSEISIAGVLIGFCLINYFYLIPTQVVAEGSSPVYPTLINTMLLLFAVAYLVEGVSSWQKIKSDAAQQEQVSSEGVGNKVFARPVAMLAVTGVWVLTLEYVGFIVSTCVFLVISSRIFGSKSWPKTLTLSVVMPFIIYFIFVGLNSLLPEGPLEELIRSILS